MQIVVFFFKNLFDIFQTILVKGYRLYYYRYDVYKRYFR